MLQVWDEISVDTHMQTEIIPIQAMQYDNITRKIRITLLDNGGSLKIDSDVSAYFYCKKPDDTVSFLSAKITDAKNGVVEVVLTNKCLSKAGKVYCMLALMRGQELLSSFYFFIEVAPNIFDINAIESTSEFKALLDALDTVKNVYDKVGDMVALKQLITESIRKINDELSKLGDLKKLKEDIDKALLSIDIVGETEF